MANTLLNRAQGRRAAVITLLIAGLALTSRSLAGYGRVLVEPIQPNVMVQMANATLDLLQGSIVHVDEFILEAAGTSSAYKAGGGRAVYWPPILGFAYYRDPLERLLPGGDGDYGFESLARIREEMERQAEGLRQIISRYRAPKEIPGPEDRYEREVFLAQQLAEASEINLAIYWAVYGRESVVGWVLSSLAHSDELLAYQENANAGLRERRGLVLAANPEWSSMGVFNLERLERLREAEAEMEGPFAEAERDLIHAQVVRFMGLVVHTRTLLAQLGEQFGAFVDETPPEWFKLPLPYHLHNPLRHQGNEHAPNNPYAPVAQMGLYVEFSYYPYSLVNFWTLVTDHFDGIFGDGPGAVLTFANPFCLHSENWCQQRLIVDPLFEPGTPISPDEEEAPEYPQYVVVLPPTVPEVLLWGSALPGETTEDWSYLVPEDVIAEHQLDGNWVLMGVYGQSLFEVESRTADLSWPPADSHLEYRLLHTGAYNQEKANGREDVKWRGFWQGLRHHSSFGGVDSTSRLPADDADFYIVAVRLAEHTWAGRYEFKIGDLPVRWALPHARNRATTKFVRRLVRASEALDFADLFEPTPSIFKYDRFQVEIETTHDVETDDRIPFLLMVSHNGGPSEIVTFKAAGGEDSTTLYASRVDGNRRLFRSEQMFVQEPAGANAWRDGDGGREVGVALAAGDRLAARVVPHGVASQAALGMVAVHTAPANVGAAWKEAVIRAAALIRKSPPKPWDQLTTDEFNAMLRTKWGTVDSTPFVQARGRQIDLALGDLAAMLLIRDEFNKEMAKVLPALQILQNRARQRPDALDVLRRDIRPDAGSPGTPLGEMAVTDPRVPFSTVPFRLVYDDAWLDRAFSGMIESQRAGARAEWLDMVTVDAVARYNRAAVDTYRLSMGREIIGYRPDTSLDLANPEQMLRLTAIGMGRIAERIKPNLLRLVKDPSAPVWDAFGWEVDPTARGYVGSIQALGVEFHNNEALVDQYNAITMVVAGGAGLLPQTVLGQGVALLVGVGSLAAKLVGDVPDYLSRKEDVQFALGAYRALGEERYISAALRRKSGWAIALDLAGGVAEVIGSLAQFRHARGAWAAAATDAEAADLLAEGATNFLTTPREAQQATLLRIAQLSDMRQGGRAMTALQETVLERGTLLLNEMETLRDIVPPRYLDPNVLEGTETLTMNDGRIATITRRGGGNSRRAAPLALADEDIPPMRIPENRLWHNYDVQTRLGYGGYAQVFEIPGPNGTVRALKVYEAGQDGLDDVQRALRAEAILAAGDIPQLRIIEHGVHNGMGYLVQEIIPPPGIYRPVRGQMMDPDMAEALLGLYQKLGQKGIGWADGWSANIYFFREVERGPLIAGILDQDRVWQIGSGINSGVWGGTSNEFVTAILGAPGFEPFKIRSLGGADFTPAARDLLERGFSPWPDAEFFMMKMLEHRKWIKYDRNLGKFVSDRLDIDLVRDYFPRLDNLESIDPMFDIPDNMRLHGPDLPIGELPDDLGGDNTVPEAELALAA